MPHAGDNTDAKRYGMDQSGDGKLDFAELQEYYKVKDDAEVAHQAELAQRAQTRAVTAARNATDYETVPGFEARRGWHGREINKGIDGRDMIYAPRHDQKAKGPFPDGAFAKMMQRGQNNRPVSPDKPADWLNTTPSYCHTPMPGWRKKSGFYSTVRRFRHRGAARGGCTALTYTLSCPARMLCSHVPCSRTLARMP